MHIRMHIRMQIYICIRVYAHAYTNDIPYIYIHTNTHRFIDYLNDSLESADAIDEKLIIQFLREKGYDIGKAIEANIITLSTESLDYLLRDAEFSTINDNYILAVQLCTYSESKSLCGQILNMFTRTMLPKMACKFIFEVIQHEFFLDLSGSMSNFYIKIDELRVELEEYLKQNEFLDDNGEANEGSDADEQGNLAGFVVDDDAVSYCTDDDMFLDDGSDGNSDTIDLSGDTPKSKKKRKKDKKKSSGHVGDDDGYDEDGLVSLSANTPVTIDRHKKHKKDKKKRRYEGDDGEDESVTSTADTNSRNRKKSTVNNTSPPANTSLKKNNNRRIIDDDDDEV